MADPVRVDVHMHLYPSAESGDWWKAGYEIWEYGEKEGVRFSRSSGTVGDALAVANDEGDCGLGPGRGVGERGD